MNKNISDAISLGKELEDISNKAYDLWTWLPSYEVAKKRHGDYAYEHQPAIADVMSEACMLLAKQKHRPNEPLTEEEKEWFNKCSCGDDECGKNLHSRQD